MISGYFAGLDVGSTVCELVVINSHGDTVYAAQFATGSNRRSDLTRAYLAGSTSFLTKPTDGTAFVGMMESLCSY